MVIVSTRKPIYKNVLDTKRFESFAQKRVAETKQEIASFKQQEIKKELPEVIKAKKELRGKGRILAPGEKGIKATEFIEKRKKQLKEKKQGIRQETEEDVLKFSKKKEKELQKELEAAKSDFTERKVVGYRRKKVRGGSSYGGSSKSFTVQTQSTAFGTPGQAKIASGEFGGSQELIIEEIDSSGKTTGFVGRGGVTYSTKKEAAKTLEKDYIENLVATAKYDPQINYTGYDFGGGVDNRPRFNIKEKIPTTLARIEATPKQTGVKIETLTSSQLRNKGLFGTALNVQAEEFSPYNTKDSVIQNIVNTPIYFGTKVLAFPASIGEAAGIQLTGKKGTSFAINTSQGKRLVNVLGATEQRNLAGQIGQSFVDNPYDFSRTVVSETGKSAVFDPLGFGADIISFNTIIGLPGKALKAARPKSAFKFTTKLKGRGVVEGAYVPDAPVFKTFKSGDIIPINKQLRLSELSNTDSFLRGSTRIFIKRVKSFDIKNPNTYFDKLIGRKPGQFKKTFTTTREGLIVLNTPSEMIGSEIVRFAGTKQIIGQVSAKEYFTRGVLGKSRLEITTQGGGNVQRQFAKGLEEGFFSSLPSTQFGFRQAYGYYAGLGKTTLKDLSSGKASLSFGGSGRATITFQEAQIAGLPKSLFRPISKSERLAVKNALSQLPLKSQKKLLRSGEDTLVKYVRFARERAKAGTTEVGSGPLSKIRTELEVTQAPDVGNVLFRKGIGNNTGLKSFFRRGDFSFDYPGSKTFDVKFAGLEKSSKGLKSFSKVEKVFNEKEAVNYLKSFSKKSSSYKPVYNVSVGSKFFKSSIFSAKSFTPKSFSSNKSFVNSLFSPVISSSKSFLNSSKSFSSFNGSSFKSVKSLGKSDISYFSSPNKSFISSSVRSIVSPPYSPPSSPPPSIRYPPIIPPSSPPITTRKKIKDDTSSMSRPSGSYDAYVRRNKNTKWVKVTDRPLPYNAAFNTGLKVADNTLGRSVQVRRKSKTDTGFDDPFINSEKFRKRKTGSKVPGQEIIFVEKARFSLDTIGEKQGIKASKRSSPWAF